MNNEPGFYVLKPTSACNFNCSFCSAKFLNIPIHNKVPNCLKQYLIEHKVKHLSISGGEPLMNPQTYFEDLISILESINSNYELGITSNLVLWEQNPEKWDWLFKNPHVIVETSFQYGNERKDNNIFDEIRFTNIFIKFKERYGYPLNFIYVVSEENEQYTLDACKLTNRLNTKLSIRRLIDDKVFVKNIDKESIIEDNNYIAIVSKDGKLYKYNKELDQYENTSSEIICKDKVKELSLKR